MDKYINCPVCDRNNFVSVINMEGVPLSSLSLGKTKDEALRAKLFSLCIVKCSNCSHLYNRSVNISEIDYNNDENLTYFSSDEWNNYSSELALDIIEKYNIKNKTVLEIGCGDGSFLKEFQKYNNVCIGYDPSYSGVNDIENIKIVNKYFSPKLDVDIEYDLVILRHVVEHMDNATDFLETLIKSFQLEGCSPLLMVEVPNNYFTLKDSRINDFVYEHISYFSYQSLHYCLAKSGATIREVYEGFGGETLISLSKVDSVENNDIGDDFNKLRDDYREILSKYDSICIWGAGGRGAAFIRLVAKYFNGSEIIVDSDPMKINKYTPSTALKICNFRELKKQNIDVIIISTALGKANIIDQINKYDINTKLILCYEDNQLLSVL